MTERSDRQQQYFEKGLKAMAAQDYEGAIAWFSALLELNPLDEEAQELCERNQILHSQKTLNVLKRIWYQIVGNFLFGLGLHKAAVYYLGVLSLDKPQDAMLAAKYGKCLMATDQPALAAMAYRRALTFLPTNRTILKGAGPAFEAIDDKPAAIEVYNTLCKLEPGQGKWPIKVKDLSAEHYGKTGGITDLKVARAEEEKKAAEQQTVEGKENRIKELLDEYKENPEEKQHLLPEVGRLLVQIEKFDHALAIWKRVAETNKTEVPTEEGEAPEEQLPDEEALYMMAFCYEKKGDLDQAEQGYAELFERFPNDPRYCDSLYEVRLKKVDEEYKKNPKDMGLLQKRHEIEKEHLETKVRVYEKLAEVRAGDPDTLLTYGDLLYQKGDLDSAIPVLQKASQNPARAFQSLRRLGAAFMEKGQIPLAIDTYERALSKAPPSKTVTAEVKDIWYGLGEAFLRQGDEQNAREWFKKIYECDINFRDVREKYEKLVES